VDKLNLKSFWGLYLVCGLACALALLIYLIQTLRQYKKHSPEELESSGHGSGSSRLRTFLSFVDEKEDIAKSRSKRRQMERISYRSTSEVGSNINSNKDLSRSSTSLNRIDATNEV
jgi:ionotropic glutamate receptor